MRAALLSLVLLGGCAAAPASVEIEASAEEGLVVASGTTVRIRSPNLEGGVHAEVLPRETPHGLACTVRLVRADGRDVGEGSVWVDFPRDPPAAGCGCPCCSPGAKPTGKPRPDGTWTRGPAPGWTGPVTAGEETRVTFDPPDDEELTAYGWHVYVTATPVEPGRVRLVVRTGTIACIR
jgi:hypothetical protein